MVRSWPLSKVAGWIAYADREGPFWAVRGDIQAAQVCQSVAASVGSKVSIGECQLDWNPPPPVYLDWKSVIRAMGGK